MDPHDSYSLSVARKDFTRTLKLIAIVDAGQSVVLEIEDALEGAEMRMTREGKRESASLSIPAVGSWPRPVRVYWRDLGPYAEVPPAEDPVNIRIEEGILWFGESGIDRFKILDNPPADSAKAALTPEPEGISPAIDPEEETFPEGALVFRYHALRERNASLAARARERAKQDTGRIACQICGFDFEETYGPSGGGFIEVHHSVPLSDDVVRRETRLNEVVLLCSNCHRMIHRRRPWLRVDQLASLLVKRADDKTAP